MIGQYSYTCHLSYQSLSILECNAVFLLLSFRYSDGTCIIQIVDVLLQLGTENKISVHWFRLAIYCFKNFMKWNYRDTNELAESCNSKIKTFNHSPGQHYYFSTGFRLESRLRVNFLASGNILESYIISKPTKGNITSSRIFYFLKFSFISHHVTYHTHHAMSLPCDWKSNNT